MLIQHEKLTGIANLGTFENDIENYKRCLLCTFMHLIKTDNLNHKKIFKKTQKRVKKDEQHENW